MQVRLAREEDIEQVLDLVRCAVLENRPWLLFDENRARTSFEDYLTTADPTVFVVDGGDRLTALSVVSINAYRAAAGLFILHEIFYVRPEYRGSRAAALMIKSIISWSQALGVREIIGGNDSGKKSNQIARFLGRFGFTPVGFCMRKVL
jgi:GNAT superfamily N-acetyltransferase